jgi:hypothetical protein
MLLQDLDGIILVIDPQHPEQEKELESLYMNFAQVSIACHLTCSCYTAFS